MVHQWADRRPFEASISAAEGWECDGGDAPIPEMLDEVIQARLDIGEVGGCPPVAFCGEVDDRGPVSARVLVGLAPALLRRVRTYGRSR